MLEIRTRDDLVINPGNYVFNNSLRGSGQRGGPVPESQNGLTWQEGDVTYMVLTAADRQVVQPRIVSLDEARNQLRGNGWDTPVLYLGYLPAFAVFCLWVTRSLFSGSRKP